MHILKYTRNFWKKKMQVSADEMFKRGNNGKIEAVSRRWVKKFPKIHRETPVPKSLFRKVLGLQLATLSKRDSGIGVFL